MSDMSKYKMRDKPTPALGRMRLYRDLIETSPNTTGIDEIETPELPIVDVAQLPTLIGVRAITITSRLSAPTFNGSLITDQPTWMLPAIPGLKRVGNQVVKAISN